MWTVSLEGVGHPVSVWGILLLGLFIGYVAGMFGVGGGFVLTPFMINIFGIPAAVSVGSALCQKCGTSISSFLKYRNLKRGDPRIDLTMLGGSLIGVDMGTRLLEWLNGLGKLHFGHGAAMPTVQVVLDILFLVMLSWVAFYTIKDAVEARKRVIPRGDLTIPGPLVTRIRIPPYVDLPEVQLEKVSVTMMAYLGFLLGAASGLMGIGGGVIFTPILMYGFGLSVRNSAGTGVLLLYVTVAVGTIEQALQGFVSLPLSMLILVGSSVGSQLGTISTHYWSNRLLRIIFACLLVATLIVIGIDLSPFFIPGARGIPIPTSKPVIYSNSWMLGYAAVCLVMPIVWGYFASKYIDKFMSKPQNPSNSERVLVQG